MHGKGTAVRSTRSPRCAIGPIGCAGRLAERSVPRDTDYIDSLRAQATRLRLNDRVRFVGERADVPRLLAAADIYCQPNISPEPFGIAFIEALAAGLPVVTSAIGGAMEIVDDTCGQLVPASDPAALSAALRRLVGDPEERARLGVPPESALASCAIPPSK